MQAIITQNQETFEDIANFFANKICFRCRRSDIVDKFYTHVGDAAQEQAIMAISFSGTGKKDNERIAEAIDFLDKEKPTPENWNRLKEILSK